MNRWPYYLALTWLFLILIMGGWWIYLMIHLSSILKVNLPQLESGLNLYRMLTWEGITFFGLLVLLSLTIVYLFTRDLNKSKSMQNFFALMAHEIKNPLAAIQVQAEALIEEKDPLQITILAERLKSSTQVFSHFMNNVLQLSSIELGDRISNTSIPLFRLIHSILKWMPSGLKGDLTSNSKIDLKSIHIYGDVRAIEIIFNNLINNIHQHSMQASQCFIEVSDGPKGFIKINITDNGQGIVEEKFYYLLENLKKRNFSKKSGFGLYLVKRLMELQNGTIQFKKIAHGLKVELFFKLHDQGHA